MDPCKVFAGTIFVNHTEKAREILKEWLEETKKVIDKDFGDQAALRNVLLQTDGKIANIGTPYFTPYDHIEKKEWIEQAVLVHFQASRTLKKVLNREHILSWDHEQLAAEKKKVLELVKIEGD